MILFGFQSMAKIVPIISLLMIICANHSICDNLLNNFEEESDEIKLLNAIISRRMDVDRQGLIGNSFLGGPLAIAAFLFGLPALPALLMAPLAIAGLRPTIGAVGQFMNSINTGAGIAHGLASLLSPPPSTDLTASASNTASSMSSATGASVSPFTSALRSISELIFNRRLSHQFFNRFQSKPVNSPSDTSTESKPSQSSSSSSSSSAELEESAQNRFGTLMMSLREVYGILKNGLRRYEITDTDCQSRIICELHQKAVGRSASLGSFTAQLLDLIGVESHLDRSNAFSERAKSFIKDFVKAAKTGLTNNDCSNVFSRCPSTSIPESPHFNKINALNSDYFKSKPNIFEINQLLNKKPNKLSIKSSFVTTPNALNYYYNNL